MYSSKLNTSHGFLSQLSGKTKNKKVENNMTLFLPLILCADHLFMDQPLAIHFHQLIIIRILIRLLGKG